MPKSKPKICLARVWKKNGGVAGAAFLVTEGCLLTCAHVVNYVFGRDARASEKPIDEFIVDFPGASNSNIQVRVYQNFWFPADEQHSPVSDIAVLEVLQELPPGCSPGNLFNTTESLRNQNFNARGFPEDSGTEARLTEGRVVGELPNQWLQTVPRSELTGHSIQPGFSGAPAWGDDVEGIIGMIVGHDLDPQKREGFVIPTHLLIDAWPEMERFRKSKLIEKIDSKLISPIEFSNLKKLCEGISLDIRKFNAYFTRLVPNSPYRPGEFCQNGFIGALKVLSDVGEQTSENAPLFEFLEYCLPELKGRASPEQIRMLGEWKYEVAKRLDIDLNAVHDRIDRERALQSQSTPSELKLFLTVKIEPDIRPETSNDDKKFRLSIWKYHDSAYQSIIIEHSLYKRNELENNLSGFLSRAVAEFSDAEQNFIIEFIIPLQLFDWNVNLIKAGPMDEPLGTLHPVVIRSWERNYDKSFSHVKERIRNKWNLCPKRVKKITEELVFHLLDVNEFKSQRNLLQELKKNDFVFFIVPLEFKITKEIFTPALTAGLSFGFWSLPSRDSLQEVGDRLRSAVCSCDIEALPAVLKNKREEEEAGKDSDDSAKDLFWSNILLLWDNPERMPLEDIYNPSADL